MPRSKIETHGTRVPLLVLAAALLAGAVIFVGVHRGLGGARPADRSTVSSPASGASATDRAAR